MGCDHGYVNPDDCDTCVRHETARVGAEAIADELREVLAVPINAELRGQLEECAGHLKAMIDARVEQHERDKGTAFGPPGEYTVWQMQDMAGRPIMADLVAARANVLVALARAT